MPVIPLGGGLSQTGAIASPALRWAIPYRLGLFHKVRKPDRACPGMFHFCTASQCHGVRMLGFAWRISFKFGGKSIVWNQPTYGRCPRAAHSADSTWHRRRKCFSKLGAEPRDCKPSAIPAVARASPAEWHCPTGSHPGRRTSMFPR